MALSSREWWGRLGYGALFTVVLPVALVVYARLTARWVTLPALDSPSTGMVLAVAGGTLLMWGIRDIVVRGRGLPMNAFPPREYVARGSYRLLAHPIYAGFVGVVLGVAVAGGSASGLWLVTPFTAAAATALVLGYEGIALRRRFGDRVGRTPLGLPPGDDQRPDPGARFAVVMKVLLPWILVEEATIFMSRSSWGWNLDLDGWFRWPAGWNEIISFSVQPAVLAVPWLLRSNRELQRFAIQGLVAVVVLGVGHLTLPLLVSPRSLSGAAALPMFQVVWAGLAARALGRRWPKLGVPAAAWVLAVTMSCVTSETGAVVSVLAGAVVVVVLDRPETAWETLRRAAESLANSWRQWSVGPLRFNNHGLWAGAATLVGVGVTGCLSGFEHAVVMAVVVLSALAGAALWGQLLGRAPLRWFHYHGAVIGSALAGASIQACGHSPWRVLAALAVAAPLAQAVGRLHCLVRGCCHGRPAPAWLGLRYRHPRSWVTRFSGLGDTPLHPTPLYSGAWNLACGLLLLRLWSGGIPEPALVGLHLMLDGLGRFVEAGYRGEPRRRVLAGLAVQQWSALLGLLAGAGLTCLPGEPAAPAAGWDGSIVMVAVSLALVVGVATGVDRPHRSDAVRVRARVDPTRVEGSSSPLKKCLGAAVCRLRLLARSQNAVELVDSSSFGRRSQQAKAARCRLNDFFNGLLVVCAGNSLH